MAGLTPMMRQYVELKEKYSDCVLLFRLGDFYEMFFEDAKLVSKELELVLTGKDCGLSERAPMCGIPYHALDGYLVKLIERGHKVAICEQMEDPAAAKGLVARDIIRIITPGTVIEERMLNEGENSYITSIFLDEERAGLAYADVSTGCFFLMELAGENLELQLYDELTRIAPRQIIAPPQLFLHQYFTKRLSTSYYLEQYGAQAYVLNGAQACLRAHFHVATLDGFGCSGLPYAVSAAGALMRYLEETQKNTLTHIHTMRVVQRSTYMALDASTRRNLELTQPLRYGGNKKNTLLYLLDMTKSGMGGRMVRSWLDCPLQSVDAINRRLDAVEELVNSLMVRKQVQEQLKGVYDVERLTSKIVYGTLNARDCLALKQTLARIAPIQDALLPCQAEALASIAASLDPMDDVFRLLEQAVCEAPPVGVKDGGVIRSGYNAEVDELRSLADGAKEWLERFETTERERTKIKNLKLGYNKVFGYYIEITRSYLSQAPYDYERKQTLANAERFITPELKRMEQKILGAKERLVALEYELFCQVREVLLACTDRLQTNASLIAELDCYQSFAEVSASHQYCRPTLNCERRIKIENGRHPVIECGTGEPFVPNDVLLDYDENRLLIITGPNMAGKSTYMRQTALITLLAHVGMYVPATSADISICDRIFTRIGASDDISGGQSTFMVEMSEVANILHNATPESLLILDEIGRGTSTFDGLSIAWAVLEYIADPARCGARALFATHYHELTELEGKLPGVKNYRITVREIGEDIVFLRKIVRGGGDKSFGIQVARLAGLPKEVLVRASEILLELEGSDIVVNRRENRQITEACVQGSLLDDTKEAGALRMLEELDMDHLTPLEALNALYSLQAMLKQ